MAISASWGLRRGHSGAGAFQSTPEVCEPPNFDFGGRGLVGAQDLDFGIGTLRRGKGENRDSRYQLKMIVSLSKSSTVESHANASGPKS